MFRFVQSDWVGVRALLSTKLVKESTTYKATSAVTAVSALIFAVTSSAAYASNNDDTRKKVTLEEGARNGEYPQNVKFSKKFFRIRSYANEFGNRHHIFIQNDDIVSENENNTKQSSQIMIPFLENILWTQNVVLCEDNSPSKPKQNSEKDDMITFRQRRLTMNQSPQGKSLSSTGRDSSNQLSTNDEHTSDHIKKKQSTQSNIDKNQSRILYSTEFDKDNSPQSASQTTSHTSSFLSKNDSTSLPFPPRQVGTYSCHGVEPHPCIVYQKDENPIELSFFDKIFGTKSPSHNASAKVVTVVEQKINQDRGSIVHPFGNHEQMALFGVFDGHGECGEMLAEYTMNAVREKLQSYITLYEKKDIEEILFKDVFQQIDEEVSMKDNFKSEHSGTTACVVLLHVNEALVANVGDSRVVKATRSIDGHTNSDGSKKLIAVDWSKDQNASDEKERQRVIQSGGYITMPHEKGLPARIWLDKNCSQIGLAMSRSIGDHALKDVGVISEPEVKAFEINENDEFLILASDGVWEFISSSEAVYLVQDCFDKDMGADEACKVLIKKAMDKWKEKEGDYRDDITAIVVNLKGLWDQGDNI